MLNYQNKTKKELIEELIALKKQMNKVEVDERPLKENELNIYSLFKNAPISYLSLNKKGVIITANNAFIKELGYNKTELENHCICEFTEQNEIKKVTNFIKSVIKIGEIFGHLILLKNKKEEILTYSLSGNSFYDPLDKQFYIHIILYNITEQQKALNALSSSE